MFSIFILFNIILYLNGTSADYDYRNHKNWPKDLEDDCGISYTDRIIGGTNASLGQYPWLARIGYQKRDGIKYNCGGVLINRWYILTAAHCIVHLAPNVIVHEIVLGENNAASEIDCEDDVCADPPQYFIPQKFIVPTNYNLPPFKHDIALIKLNKAVKLTEWVRPICLPSGDLLNQKHTGESTEIAGWGLTDSDNMEGTPFLQTVKLPILDLSECALSFGSSIDLTKDQRCVGGLIGKDSCSGDSGGPMVKAINGPLGPRYYLLGIVSFGPKRCGESKTPGIYTNTDEYIPWIVVNID